MIYVWLYDTLIDDYISIYIKDWYIRYLHIIYKYIYNNIYKNILIYAHESQWWQRFNQQVAPVRKQNDTTHGAHRKVEWCWDDSDH